MPSFPLWGDESRRGYEYPAPKKMASTELDLESLMLGPETYTAIKVGNKLGFQQEMSEREKSSAGRNQQEVAYWIRFLETENLLGKNMIECKM